MPQEADRTQAGEAGPARARAGKVRGTNVSWGTIFFRPSIPNRGRPVSTRSAFPPLLSFGFAAAFLLAGTTYLEWGPFGSTWLMWGGVAACMVAGLLVDRWYRNNYGRVTPLPGTRVRDTAWTAFGVFAVIGFAIVDSLFDMPVNGYVSAYALMMLGYIATSIGLKLRHAIVWGGLLSIGLLPVWGVDDVGVGLFPMGIATMISGAIDHRAFVANLGPSRLNVENGNAGA